MPRSAAPRPVLWALLGAILCLPPAIMAQKVDDADTVAAIDSDEDVITLSPFEVKADDYTGYTATTSLAGSRLNTQLRDIAAAVQVITPEFMKDIGATNLQSLLVYTTNTEVSGIGGNFYGGDTWDKGKARSILIDPQRTTRIRGLNDADLTRDFFPSDIPIDWYSLSRVDISRGPNSILFGLGSPAGLVNNTLKVPNMSRNSHTLELRVDGFGSTRESLDLDEALIPGTLGLRIVGLNDDAKFRQDFTFNHDQRLFGALRWQPKIGRGIYTQIDVSGETGRINANRPVAGTPSDFLSTWYRPEVNKLTVPTDEYWVTLGPLEGRYIAQTAGGQLWDDHPVSFYSNPNSAAVGMPGDPQAMTFRGQSNYNGGGWGSWVGVLNPNWNGDAGHYENQAAYYANNPVVSGIIGDFESQTGKTFAGFGSGLWPTQMIVSGPLATLMEDQNLIGPNKSEFNNFDVLNLKFTQTYFHDRFGLEAAYNKQDYTSGYTNLIEGLWGVNMISVDVNESLRGSNTIGTPIPNPNFGRPYTIGEGRGGIFEKKRENWRVTGFATVKAEDFLDRDGWLAKILGEHTFTGVASHQRYENFDRYYALYRWDEQFMLDRLWHGYPTWRGIHYLGGSILNTDSMNDLTGITGVRTDQSPPLNQSVWYEAHDAATDTWAWGLHNNSLLSSQTDIDRLYDGASQGFDTTDSKVFVWQGRMLKGAVVPIFGWREDKYERWNKPSNVPRDGNYGFVKPFSPDWNYDNVTPITADEQRRSWSIAVHGKELMEMLGRPLPGGMDVTLMYNDSSSFRPSDVAVDVYGRQEPTPSGETKDWSVIVSALQNRVSLRVTKYKTVQHNTPYFGPQPAFNGNKAMLGRSMDGMMWEVGGWAGADPTKRVQTTPEWLVNKWMFGDSYDKSVENTPLPADWRNHPEIMNQPLRVRASAVPTSPTYVAQGDINPDLGIPYVAPPLTAEEVAYRAEWFKSRSDAEWSRPVDPDFWKAMNFQRDYTATWGGFWEPDAWTLPQGMRSLNDLTSTGVEYELTANPMPNWRISLNASKAEAKRTNVLASWDDYIAKNSDFWLDGGYAPNDQPAANYWTVKGYYDIAQTPGDTLGYWGRFGTEMVGQVYSPYYQAKATEDQAVNELRKWHFNAITNYTFTSGILRNVGIGGAVRWEDHSNLGYYPKFNPDANAWVSDLNKPIKGPTETNFDAWVSYERKIGHGVTWSIQLNVYNLFSDDKLIPTLANPDGTIAQVRIPARTSWALTNTFRF